MGSAWRSEGSASRVGRVSRDTSFAGCTGYRHLGWGPVPPCTDRFVLRLLLPSSLQGKSNLLLLTCGRESALRRVSAEAPVGLGECPGHHLWPRSQLARRCNIEIPMSSKEAEKAPIRSLCSVLVPRG